jgi:hypothetical protein
VTELLDNALRKVATLPQGEQDAIASQILETIDDETAWTIPKKPSWYADIAPSLSRDCVTQRASSVDSPNAIASTPYMPGVFIELRFTINNGRSKTRLLRSK